MEKLKITLGRALFFLGLFLLYLAGNRWIGITWDEPRYFDSTQRLMRSLSHMARQQATLQDYRDLTIHFEKPQSSQIIAGFFQKALWFLPPEMALRLFTGLLFFTLIYFAGVLLEKDLRSLFYPVCLLLFFTPRLYGHAHIYAQDMARCAGELIALWFFVRGTEKRSYACFYGVVQGIVMGFHLGTWVLPPVLILWGLLAKKDIRFQCLSLLVAPFIYFLSNPMLWSHPLESIRLFLDLNLKRSQWDRVPLYYLGETVRYFFPYREPADYPWHYPLVMFFLAMPTVTFLLLFLFAFRAKKLGDLDKLFVVLTFLPLLLLLPPWVLKYDGVRLFLPSFIYASLLATKALRDLPRAWWAVILAVHILEGLLFAKAPLSSFNLLSGWTRGAYRKKLEVTYWGDAMTGSFMKQLEKEARPYKTIAFAGVSSDVVAWWQSKGYLRKKTIRTELFFSPNELKNMQLFVLYGRFSLFSSLYWRFWKKGKPLLERRFMGVPLIKVFVIRRNLRLLKGHHPQPSSQ